MTVSLFYNARIYTPVDRGRPAAGGEQGELTVYEDGALAVEAGQILAVGESPEVKKALNGKPINTIDCHQQCMVPGFVDPHTHICFAQLREQEFDLRIAGTAYLEIL